MPQPLSIDHDVMARGAALRSPAPEPVRDERRTSSGARPGSDSHVVAYMMSRFPKITETFILYEMLAVEEAGVRVELYPLMRERTQVMHPEARPLVARANFLPYVSWPILRAQARSALLRPRAYFGALGTLVRATWASPRLLLGGLAIFPKSVYMAEHMRQAGVQHIHAHFATHPAAAALVIHRLTGIPYSFTAHGSDLHVDQHMLREKVHEAAAVVTISRYNKDFILSHCGERYRDKVHLVHCGVDTEVFHPVTRKRDGALNVLCTGTLHEVKGQIHLIRACRRLADDGIDFVCRLVGDGPDHDVLEQEIAALGLTDRVCLLGRRDRGQIAELLRQADVVVTPSVPTRSGRREGIPVVLMEAMSSGLPVVASAISGIPEIVEHDWTGLLVPAGDPEALAAALRRLARDPSLREQLGMAGRQKVLEGFDVRANARDLAGRFRAWSQGLAGADGRTPG